MTKCKYPCKGKMCCFREGWNCSWVELIQLGMCNGVFSKILEDKEDG